MSSGGFNKTITIEELVALNDEIIGLVRGGVPLELGLKGQLRGMPAGISRISLRLATHLSRGESLSEAFASADEHFPPAYRAVVEAGQRSGRLAAALEDVSRYARDVLELRRKVGLALLYPAIIMCVAYVLTFYISRRFCAILQYAYIAFNLPVSTPLRWLTFLEETSASWLLAFPVVMLLLTLWWILSGTSKSLHANSLRNPLEWIPTFGRLKRTAEWAGFADLLGLLVGQQVPLPVALPLAAEATAGRELQSAARNLAQSISRGEAPSPAAMHDTAFPPFLRWLVAHGHNQGTLAESLKKAAETYRSRAVMQAEWLTFGFPILVTAVVGGGFVLLYALTYFLPIVDLVRDLNTEPRILY